jgi:GAF domain-containing protein
MIDMVSEEDLNVFRGKIVDMLPEATLKEVSDVVLASTKSFLKSESCYVAFVDPENGDSVGISFSHLTGDCQMYEEMGEARFKVLNDGSYGGLLGYSLDTGKSLYVHDIANHPAAHGLPPGHEPVSQFLSVPVKSEGKVIGQIVAGNPEKDYDERDLRICEEIAEVYGVVLKELLYK